MKIAIIGAGIGGLALALALQRQEHEVTVFEAAAEIKQLGAGLWLAPNGLAVLQQLGTDLLTQALATGFASSQSTIMTHTGQMLMQLKSTAQDAWPQMLAIRRSELHQILLSALRPHSLQCGAKLQSYQEQGTGLQLQFDKGDTQMTELLIGADGLHSCVRQQMFGDLPLRYSGQTCWRGLSMLRLPPEWAGQGFEIWGDRAGLRAGFSQIDADTVYFYITALAEAGQHSPNEKKQVLNLIEGFPAVVQQIVSAAPELMRHDLYDLKPLKSYQTGSVALVGDAAHAMTPNLGQGANQALVSALTLADCLQTQTSLAEALQVYENLRRPRASSVIQASWQVNQMVNLQAPWLRGLRNFALSHLPPALVAYRLKQIYRLER